MPRASSFTAEHHAEMARLYKEGRTTTKRYIDAQKGLR